MFNYIDKPDMNMNELVQQVEKSLDKKLLAVRLPYWLGYLGGLSFDLLAKITGKKFSISAVRVKKICANKSNQCHQCANSVIGLQIKKSMISEY